MQAADALEVGGRLDPDAAYRTTVIESVKKRVEERKHAPESAATRRRRAESARLMQLPEVQEHLRKLAEDHWRTWFDEPVPALGKLTPRQASRTAAGRERLEALLLGYAESAERDPGSPFRADVPALRKALGPT